MLAIQRREKIKELIAKEKQIFVAPLSKEFNVTEETIRRDLQKLEKEGIVKKTYGGAVLISEINKIDIPFSQRSTINLEKKRNIAIKSLQLVNNSLSLMVDSSSTVLETVKLLKQFDDITVITNSILISHELASSNCTVIGVGGKLNRRTLSFQGNITKESLERYNVDLALVSTKGLSFNKGLTDSNELEVEIKKTMIKQSKKVALLIDSSKFDTVAFLKLCPFSDIDYIITDNSANEILIKICKEHKITLI